MKRRSTLFYVLALIGVLGAALLVSAMSSAAPVAGPPAAKSLQDTIVVTVAVTPPVEVTPVVVVTGTGVIAPTGGGAPIGGSWLFLAILVIAGLAFLVAIFALMRRPYP
ncbi:MAG: hypothetical protein ACM3QS_09405 [Bacteroidota bacterium]